MTERPRHHKPLEKRFSIAMTPEAYANLRRLAEETGLGNDYVLTVLLEDMERAVNLEGFRQAARDMLERHRREPEAKSARKKTGA